MQDLGPAPEVLKAEDIIARHGSALDACIKAADDPQYQFEQQVLINQARQNWLMVRGFHFTVPGMVTTPWGQVADYVPFDPSTTSDDNGADVKLCPPLNVLGGDGFKYCAVMGQAAPRVKGVADDPEDPDSIQQGRDADACIRDVWQKEKIDRRWSAVAFHQYTTGPAFIRTVFRQDRRKYGQTVEPRIEVLPGEDGVPVPVQTGVETYENGDAEMQVYSCLEVSITPFTAKTLDEVHMLTLDLMRSKFELLEAYPDQLDQYRTQDVPDDDFSATSAVGSEARNAVSNPSGTGRIRAVNQWRFREYWLQPFLYEAIPDKAVREVLQRQYADGLYVAKVGNIIVRIANVKLTDEWVVCKVGRGDKIMDRPLCADSVPIQRALNDLGGMALETVLRAITQTIVDSQLLDRESMAKKEAVPAEVIFTALPVDGDIQKRIAQIQPARLSDQVVPLFNAFRALMQDISGIRPELSGGGAPTQTYREARQRRDQALMQLGPQAREMRFAAEDVATNLTKLRARYGSGTIKAKRKTSTGLQSDIVDMARLSETGWHAESDDNFPMLLTDRRDQMWSALKELPEPVQQALGILDPLNIEQAVELAQIPGFDSPAADQKEKTLDDVQRLLAEQPVDGPPNPDGTPGAKQPSIPVDPYDNHGFVADFLAKWMISKTGQRAKNENPAGFANVEAFQAAHFQMAQPPAPPAPPPVRGNLNVSLKGEDFPQLLPAALEAAGIPADQIPAPTAAVPPPPPEPQPDLGRPAPIEPDETQESPIPQLPARPSGPQAMVQ